MRSKGDAMSTFRLCRSAGLLLTAALALTACGPEAHLEAEDYESEPVDDRSNEAEQGLVSCASRNDTGYSGGRAFSISVVTADGRPVERDTANAYAVMQEAAARQGVNLRVVSGFRTNSEQAYLYSCYTNCSCNSCNLAARPGYSNHQSGHALDLNTRDAGVYNWLANNASRFGFRRTVPSEPWHWEWWGGGPGGGPCGGNVDASGCTAQQREACGNFGCSCANGKCSGGFCEGNGCTAEQTNNCGKFGCGCVDGKCAGGFCDGSGCTAKQVTDCGKFGCGCADGKCSGGFCDGGGCTAKQVNDCGKFGCGCVDGKCSGGFCEGTGCTAKQTNDCGNFGCGCAVGKCSGGFCGG